MRKEVLGLLKLPDIEKAVCGLLITKGLAKGEIKYSSLVLTELSKTLLRKVIGLDAEFVKEYRSLFPADKKSTPLEVSEKMGQVIEEGFTIEEILEATKWYMSEVTDQRFCETAGYFISKKIDGSTRSTLRSYLERLKEE